MSFFYDLNKKLDAIRQTPSKTHGQLNERDMGKHNNATTGFKAVADKAAKEYGSKAAGERVAGAQFQKMKKAGQLEEEGFPAIQAARKKYGDDGLEALRNKKAAGASKKTMQATRKEYDKYDNEEVNEESGEWSKIPVGVIDGPGGYEGAQQRIQDYESGNINRDGKKLPPVVDRSRPADSPTVYDYRGKPEEYASPPGWKGKYIPPVVDRSRSATDESGGPSAAAKPTKPATQAPAKPSKPAPKGEFMGTIKGGVWTADPPKPGERGVPAPSGDPEGVPESGAPMTAKQKSFAKLAPPANKITFADKIAGAKKEVDEMLGDVAAEAMRNALSPKQKKMAALGGDPKRIDGPDLAALRKGAKMGEDNAFDYKSPRKDAPRVGSVERGHKHDIKHTATGRMVTRRTDDQGNSVGADDDTDAQQAPRGRGRPKGTKGAIGAKGPSGKSKLMTREGDLSITDQGEYDQEGDMAKDDIKTIVRHAQALSRVLGDNDNLPEWVQSKLAKIEGMMISIDEYMQNQASDDGEEEPIAEKAVSKKQQRFMGMVHAAQKGEKPASKEVGKVAKTMKKSDAEDFAKTKHKGLPEKAKKKEVDENSDQGRLTTTQTSPGQSYTTSSTGRVSATIGNGKMTVKPGKPDKPMDDDVDTASSSTKDTSSTKSNSMVGKGIYDSMNRELELMIAESMSINMSDSTEGNQSLTVTATDEDAMRLAMMLKSAGLGGQGRELQGDESCSTCGMQDCGCGDVHEAVDENAPDWPTNTEQADNNFGYAGGLNKPKTDVAGDGQTTTPNQAVHTQEEDALRRMMEQAGIKIKNNLGPTSPEIARMSKDEVDAALKSGISPNTARMSKDEVDAALKSGMRPDTSDMNPDGVYGGSGSSNDPPQYEDSIRRMREMAGIKEAKKQVDQNGDGKNDFEDIKIARMKASGAIDDKEEKKVDESIFALTNQWRAYKG